MPQLGSVVFPLAPTVVCTQPRPRSHPEHIAPSRTSMDSEKVDSRFVHRFRNCVPSLKNSCGISLRSWNVSDILLCSFCLRLGHLCSCGCRCWWAWVDERVLKDLSQGILGEWSDLLRYRERLVRNRIARVTVQLRCGRSGPKLGRRSGKLPLQRRAQLFLVETRR